MQIADLDARLTAPDAHLPAVLAWLRANRTKLVIAAIAAMTFVGFVALRTLLAEVHLRDVRDALGAVGPDRIAAATSLTALSYLALTGYDWCALLVIGKPLPWRTAALASFTSYALSHNLGFSLLTGGSARYRAYTAAGLDFADVARITVIASATFWTGVVTMAAVALFVAGQPIAVGAFILPVWWQAALGAGLLTIIAGLFVVRLRGKARIGFGSFSLPLPTARMMLAQLGIATVDMGAASGALFVLVPHASAAMFGAFFLAYAVGIIVALLTHVPGGIGVFEATILALTPAAPAEVVAALILYRMIYYLLPLVVAGALMALVEGHRLRTPIGTGLSALNTIAQATGPTVIAAMVFAGGAVLLFSGVTPGLQDRMTWLNDMVPFPFIEASHFAASLVGVLLLVIAPALQSRLASGFQLARALLVGGATLSILKGVDYEEAAVLLTIAACLQYCRPAFYRRAGVGTAPISRWWWAAIIAAFFTSAWVGLIAYRRIPYSPDLWWDFAWADNAPRYLRAVAGSAIALAAFAVWRLLTAPASVQTDRLLPRAVADSALQAARRTDAMLAFTGDKSFIISAGGDAFLMYAVHGRSWIVMGDPVGPASAWPELLWDIRRRADAVRGRLCLYQVSRDMLPHLVDLGMQAIKYGEEAIIDLDRVFAIDGKRFKDLRHALRKATVEGLTFDIVAAANVPAIGPELAIVSEAWLKGKPGREKGFSVGRFDRDYMARFDCAVLRHKGRIVAFANIWALRNGEEMSIDLMRHVPDTPYGTMDFLFLQLIRHAAAQGYKRFNLGMAPLSGLSREPLAPTWSKLGALVYAHGERLYGFSGLRAFKAKFGPRWEPLYIGLSPTSSTLRALGDLIAIVDA